LDEVPLGWGTDCGFHAVPFQTAANISEESPIAAQLVTAVHDTPFNAVTP
jgi:hypothetical protein